MGGRGARLEVGGPDELPDELLFGEDPCGFLVSGPREALERLKDNVPVSIFGTVGGDALELAPGGHTWSLAELREAWGSLAALFP